MRSKNGVTTLSLVTLLGAALVSCDGGGGSACVPGSTRLCNCTATLAGVQSCGGDGVFEACACEGFDAGPVRRDAGPVGPGSDAGVENAACSCTWSGTVTGASNTQLFVRGVTSSGDLVYSENPDDASDDRVLHIGGCHGPFQRLTASDVGSPRGDLVLVEILPNDVLLLETRVLADPGERFVFWDLGASRALATVESASGIGRVAGTDGRGHTIVSVTAAGGARTEEEYDETGTHLRDVSSLVAMGTISETLAEGWLMDVGGEPQLLLDGVLRPSSRSLPNVPGVFRGTAGTPLADGRRFATSREDLGGLVRDHFSEVDLTGAVIWDGSVDFESEGRGQGACNRGLVMTESGGWMGCWGAYRGPIPGGVPSVTTAYLFRFDVATGELLASHEYPTSDTERCAGAPANAITSDGCGGIYASMPAPDWDLTRCATLAEPGTDLDERYLIEHFGADGIRD